jgi:uncharacterized protein
MTPFRTDWAKAGLLGLGIAAAIAADGALAFGQQPPQQSGLIDPSQIPKVHNTFYKVPEGAIGWDLLGDLEIRTETIAPLQTMFHTDYRPEVKALAGHEIKVMGFLYPLEGGVEHDHFLLTAWPPTCPFCLPAGPSQMVEVFCAKPVAFTEGAIMMAGTFEVLHDDPSGLFYRMHEAHEVQRFDYIRWNGTLPQQPQTPGPSAPQMPR